jgi:hypothetical protein
MKDGLWIYFIRKIFKLLVLPSYSYTEEVGEVETKENGES